MNEQMNEQVKRYHRSFIGLMEQCNEGEWVQSEDFDMLKQQQETASNNTHYYSSQALDFENEVYTYQAYAKQLEQACKERTTKLTKAKRIISRYRCFTIFVLVSCIVLEILGRVL